MKPLLRIWHFFAGHPVDELFAFLDAEGWECEGCGKQGRRL